MEGEDGENERGRNEERKGAGKNRGRQGEMGELK
jgi:hypothetical protein